MTEQRVTCSGVQTIGIVGYPGAGKTTLADSLTAMFPVIHTDDYLNLPHQARPEAILADLRVIGTYVVEGTCVSRLFERGWQPDLLIFVRGGHGRADCASIRKMIDGKMRHCLAPVEFVDGMVELA